MLPLLLTPLLGVNKPLMSVISQLLQNNLNNKGQTEHILRICSTQLFMTASMLIVKIVHVEVGFTAKLG